MKWHGSNLRVDLMTKTDYQMASDHSTSNRRSRCSCCRKGLLLKILLLVILVLLTQIAIMYLQIQSMKAWSEVLTKKMKDTTELTDVIKQNKGTSEELPPLRDDGEKTKIVIYSYTGIEELPSGDMIQDILSQHPDVFFLHQPTKLLNSSIVQRTSSDAERQEMITNLLSCDSQLLGRLKQIMFRDIHKPALRRRHTGCRSPHDCRHLDLRKRCKAAPVSVIDVYKDYTSDLGLKDIFSLNDSAKFVHIVADPRQVTYSLWLQQREDSDRERIAITKDNQLIADIASDYCDGLMSDIRAVKKMKSHPEGVRELPLLYHFIRYEDYINNTMAEMMELFNYLQMHLTEEMKDNMESAEQKIEVLADDVHSSIKDIVEPLCAKPMEILGYPTTQEIGRRGMFYLKRYKHFWEPA